jgi:hypothetical protein
LKKTTKFINEVWLSLVEHYVRDVGAAGSNPVTSTIFLKARWFLSACFFVYKRIFETRRGMKIMFVEKDVSERILSLYDAEDLELCEAYAVDAHLGENLPEFTTVYRAEPEHFCFVINPDRIGRNYFKLYNHRFPEEATKMARICFFDASYCKEGSLGKKTFWILNPEEKQQLLQILQRPCEAGNTVWKKLIETFCWEADEERIPLDTPIPDYTKLEG